MSKYFIELSKYHRGIIIPPQHYFKNLRGRVLLKRALDSFFDKWGDCLISTLAFNSPYKFYIFLKKKRPNIVLFWEMWPPGIWPETKYFFGQETRGNLISMRLSLAGKKHVLGGD